MLDAVIEELKDMFSVLSNGWNTSVVHAIS